MKSSKQLTSAELSHIQDIYLKTFVDEPVLTQDRVDAANHQTRAWYTAVTKFISHSRKMLPDTDCCGKNCNKSNSSMG